MRSKIGKKYLLKKIAIGAAAAILGYFFVCGFFPPLFRKKFTLDLVSSRKNDLNCAERAAVIDDNQSALLYRLRLIERAENEILLSTYSFYNDESGADVACALFAAAERGVKVKIIIDGFNQGKLVAFSGFKALAGHENAEVKIYNPVNPFAFWRANFRLHDKYLVCDDDFYILGGRNIGDYFLGEYGKESKRNIDRDVLVSCPSSVNADAAGGGEKTRSIGEVKEYFSRVWQEKHNARFEGSERGKRYEKQAETLRTRYAAMKEKFPEISQPIDVETETTATRGITLLHGETQAWVKQPLLWKSLLNELKGGGETTIQTPYAICDKAMYSDLTSLAESGAAITIVTNAVESGANPWGCADFLNEKLSILKTGAGILEISGARSSHVKTILSGGNMSYIGSFNLDMRSAYLNTETVLAIDCEKINEELKAQVRSYAASGVLTRRNPDGGYEFLYGENYAGGRVPIMKNLVYSALRILILPVRHLL